MITSFFSKSKTINFIIIFFVAFLALLIYNIKDLNAELSFVFVLKQIAVIITIYVSLLLLNFILRKNNLTKKNNYEMLFFSVFLLYITQTTGHFSVILANFFVLLGFRRIISLQSQKNIKKKLFDASSWIAIASLFYFWSILFFILIPIALAMYSDNNIKHWIITLLGVLTIFVISISTSIVIFNEYFEFYDTTFQISYDFSSYNTKSNLIAITLLLSFGIWSSIFFLKNIKNQKKTFRISHKIIAIYIVVAYLVVMHVPNKNGSEFLFMFAPLSIVITHYIEMIEEKWFKEIFLSILILAPFILLFL